MKNLEGMVLTEEGVATLPKEVLNSSSYRDFEHFIKDDDDVVHLVMIEKRVFEKGYYHIKLDRTFREYKDKIDSFKNSALFNLGYSYESSLEKIGKTRKDQKRIETTHSKCFTRF